MEHWGCFCHNNRNRVFSILLVRCPHRLRCASCAKLARIESAGSSRQVAVISSTLLPARRSVVSIDSIPIPHRVGQQRHLKKGHLKSPIVVVQPGRHRRLSRAFMAATATCPGAAVRRPIRVTGRQNDFETSVSVSSTCAEVWFCLTVPCSTQRRLL